MKFLRLYTIAVFVIMTLWFLTQLGLNYWFLGGNEPFREQVRKLLILQTFLPFCGGVALLLLSARLQRLVEGTERSASAYDFEAKDAVYDLPLAGPWLVRHQRDFHKAVNEHSIVAVTNQKGVIIFVNDLFCKISGYSRNELLGKTHRVVNSGKHPAEFFKEMWQTISEGSVWRGNIENKAKDGSHYFVATTIMPCLGADGKPVQYIAIRTDITEQKTAAARLALVSHELEAKNRDLEVLIHAASHDLRSPLINIKGFSSIIKEQVIPLRNLFDTIAIRNHLLESGYESLTHMEESVRFICAGTDKMDALLRGLLIFSRLGRKMPQLQIVNAERVVNECLSAIQFQIDEAAAEVTLHPLPDCLGDPSLFGQVVSNLVDNALKYREQTRPLKFDISGSTINGESFYRFADNGIGIEEQHYDRVFELFHQLNPRHRTDGHGIGLAVVKRALDRMGGRITVKSAFNHGTVFTVALASKEHGF